MLKLFGDENTNYLNNWLISRNSEQFVDFLTKMTCQQMTGSLIKVLAKRKTTDGTFRERRQVEARILWRRFADVIAQRLF